MGNGGTSHFSVKKKKKSIFFLFFTFFLVLLRLDLLFGEVRGVVGEVRLIFDVMAPFVLGCSPGKNFSPWGHSIFHGRGSVSVSAVEDPELAWHALGILAQIQQSSFIQVNT